MSQKLSPNTQAILLLTAPLIIGRNADRSPLLTLGEYKRLARLLRDEQKQPGDLIGPDARQIVSLCETIIEPARLEGLLGRGFLLSQAVDRWSARAIWIVSRADSTYPRRIKARLKEDAPPVLYGCGDPALLETGGLAVVGSRHVDEELIEYTEHLGSIAAAGHCTVISGAAKGIDRAAMHGALDAGGPVVGVMSEDLERAVLARDNREPLMEHRLVLASPYDPASPFNVGHAMQRNKLIYALADAALVVTSDFEKGGTWAGAIEQLDRLHFVPMFVRNGSHVGEGNAALLQRGAHPWPNPANGVELQDALSAAKSIVPQRTQDNLPFDREERNPVVSEDNVEESTEVPIAPAQLEIRKADRSPSAEKLLAVVEDILSEELKEGRTEAAVAEVLGVSKSQAKAWLAELVRRRLLEKVSKPVRYRVPLNSGSLL